MLCRYISFLLFTGSLKLYAITFPSMTIDTPASITCFKEGNFSTKAINNSPVLFA